MVNWSCFWFCPPPNSDNTIRHHLWNSYHLEQVPSPVVRVPHVLFLILITTLGGCCIKFPHSKEEESKASKVKQCAQPYTIVSGWSAQNCLALSPYSILSSAARVIFWKYKYSHILPWASGSDPLHSWWDLLHQRLIFILELHSTFSSSKCH